MGSHRETGETVAIKQIPKKMVRHNKVNQEIEILRMAGKEGRSLTSMSMYVVGGWMA